METPTWVIMPVVSSPEMTEAAIADVLAQSVPTRLLVINQGVDSDFRNRLERIAEQESESVFLWSHDPPLPSLGTSWNRALDFVWQTGGEEALVVNNDVRLHAGTVEWLQKILLREKALFVSCVGVTAEQFKPDVVYTDYDFWDAHSDRENAGYLLHRGGPDFSCFLISRECHTKYRFDENFVPAYCEDLDYHRRLMLAGDGHRIFSVNLPYLHFAAGTLKSVTPEKKRSIERAIETSRGYYARKWGGPVNQETFYAPFDDRVAYAVGVWEKRCGPTTPEIQRWLQTPLEEDLPAADSEADYG